MAFATAAPATKVPKRVPMDAQRKTSLTAGVLYLITFVSIPTLALYGPIREAGYIVGTGPDTGAIVGGILELIVALAGVGTAVVLYPIVRRQNETLALGFVGSRVVEAATILVGVGSLLTIVTLRQDGAGADAMVIGDALVALYDRAFLLGQSTMPIVNALLLGTLMYQSRLVPRLLPVLGLIGAPLLLAANTGILFDLWDRTSAIPAIAFLPIAIWEFSLGVYLVVKGFRPEGLARLGAPSAQASA
jgi:hypothetical protein